MEICLRGAMRGACRAPGAAKWDYGTLGSPGELPAVHLGPFAALPGPGSVARRVDRVPQQAGNRPGRTGPCPRLATNSARHRLIPCRMHPSPAARSAAATCRRRRSQLSQLLAAALVVAMLSGTTSYRMHMAEHRDGDDWAGGAGSSSSSGGVEWHASSSRSGPLAGLRSWLAGSSSASRRSLREGPPGLDAVSLAVPRTPRPVASVDPGLDAAGAHQFDRWWMLGGRRLGGKGGWGAQSQVPASWA